MLRPDSVRRVKGSEVLEIVNVDFVSVRRLLAAGHYVVPDFQRPYAWGTDNIDEFWGDLTDPERHDPYFVGPVVVYDAVDGEIGIVDGQQRLTTVILLFAVIRDLARAEGLEPIAARASECLLPGGGTRPVLRAFNGGTALAAVQRGDARNQRLRLRGRGVTAIRRARDRLALNLDEYLSGVNSKPSRARRLDALIERVLELRVVRSHLRDAVRAFTFFETLNSRGADLETVDLLKNLLFQKRSAGGAESESIRDAWDAFISELGSRHVAPKTMLYHWWLAHHGYVTKRAMYAAIREEYFALDPDEALARVNDLEVASRHYGVIARPRQSDWPTQLQDVFASLERIGSYGVAQPRPFLLQLVAKHAESSAVGTRQVIRGRQLRTALEAVELFHLVYNAVAGRSSLPVVSEGYARCAVALSRATTSDEANQVIRSLRQMLGEPGLLPTRDVFTATMVDQPRYVDKPGRNRAIERLLMIWNEENGIDVSSRAALTIEHWESRKETLPWTNSIGNLALLPNAANIALDSESTAEKRRMIGEGVVDTAGLYTSDLSATWSRDVAEDRARRIAEAVYARLERALSD
jgi:hypothetical protein